VFERGNEFQGRRSLRRCLLQEARDGLGHEPTLLCMRTPLDEHLQVQRHSGQPLRRALADGSKVLRIDISQQALLQIGIP
jgi:hypothetical protein